MKASGLTNELTEQFLEAVSGLFAQAWSALIATSMSSGRT